MRPESRTDHIALRICDALLKPLNGLGRVSGATGQRLHRLAKAGRTPGEGRTLTDLRILFGNINLAWKNSSLRDQQS